MRNLSILVIFAVALHAGTALAGVKEIAQPHAQNRAKLLQHFNKMQRAYEQGEKKLKSARYLEDVKPGMQPKKGPTVVLKGKDTRPRIPSGSASAGRLFRRGWKELSKPEWEQCQSKLG